MHIGKYESSEGHNIGTAVTFLLIGLGAGALVGLLLAPKSGKALRRDIQRGYEDTREKLGDWADEAAENIKDRVHDAGERVRNAASRGVEVAADLGEDLREAAREKVEPLRRVIQRG
jgi:gas vesicle protein